jgi:hypothetical protein
MAFRPPFIVAATLTSTAISPTEARVRNGMLGSLALAC